MTASETGANLVRINRLKDGRTCNVSVTADDNTLEALQDAKEKAVAIAREINDPLNSELVEGAPEELAF